MYWGYRFLADLAGDTATSSAVHKIVDGGFQLYTRDHHLSESPDFLRYQTDRFTGFIREDQPGIRHCFQHRGQVFRGCFLNRNFHRPFLRSWCIYSKFLHRGGFRFALQPPGEHFGGNWFGYWVFFNYGNFFGGDRGFGRELILREDRGGDQKRCQQ